MTGHDDFVRVAGEAFAHDGGATLTLHDVSELTEQHGTRSFSLVFRGNAQPLEQGIHALRHRELGEIEIFLVPIGEHDGVRDYEAVFSDIAAAAT